MRKTICILPFLLIILVLLNCCNLIIKDEHYKNDWGLDKFEKIYTRDSCKIYIIPNSGCSSCISNAETFALANQKDKEFIFLFTKISSLKLFKNRFSDTFYNSSNVILDSTNLFISPDQNNEIYPMVILKDKINFRIINILNPSK